MNNEQIISNEKDLLPDRKNIASDKNIPCKYYMCCLIVREYFNHK